MSDLDAELVALEVRLLDLERRFGAGRPAVQLPPRSAPVEHGDPVKPVVVPAVRGPIHYGRLRRQGDDDDD